MNFGAEFLAKGEKSRVVQNSIEEGYTITEI